MSLSTNIKNKCVVRKANIYYYLFFDVMDVIFFPSKVSHFQYDHRFVFKREMENIRSCQEVRLQNLIKFRLSG